MFKCTDCGQLYDTKPEYCDCGNNVFIEEQPEVKSQVPKQQKISASQPHIVYKKTIDLYAILIFIACIILSICSWVFIGSGNNTSETKETVSKSPKAVNIPSIDELWKENTYKPRSEVVVEEKPISQPVVEPKKITILPKKEKKETNVVVEKPQNKVQEKVQQTTVQSMTEEEKQALIKKLTTKNIPEVKKEPVKKLETTKNESEVKEPTPVKVDYAAQKRELNAYKIALRNKLGGSINFAAVIGDGKCAVTFKLDSTGNLINRSFSLQSSNDSLNDAVYAAVMQNPTFKAPPEGYKNETLTLSVKMYGGQFEVDLK